MARAVFLPLLILSLTCFSSSSPPPASSHLLKVLGPQGVNFWRLDQQQARAQLASRRDLPLRKGLTIQDGWKPTQGDFLESQGAKVASVTEFVPQWFEQPLDHFDESNTHTFKQRYWVNKRHYQARVGAPVIVIDGGETSGEDRLPYLDTGIADILASATNGVGVVLEHRYYGESIAVQNLTTDSLRWLSNEQAAADSANFMAKVKFDGIDEDLTAPGTPWIYYGGSYAGARAAHMKILYPDLVWGSIASSGVTHAAIENWQYMEVIRNAADPTCSSHLVASVNVIDTILLSGIFKKQLKGLFGLADLQHDQDFASTISGPLGSWQSKNWDPAVDSTSFDKFCTAINAPLRNISAQAVELPFGHPERMVEVEEGFSLDLSVLNYASYIKNHTTSRCTTNVEECFGTFNDTVYQETGLDQTWRLWMFQVCTQWGYFTTTPPDPQLPRILSRTITLPYESKICQQAYLPGEFFQVPPLPNITAVNALGDFDIAADRLAIIDGQVDPWRPDTPHSDDARPRPDTTLRPFKLIPGAVHHWDENGLADLMDEPDEIKDIHADEVAFVEAWLEEWKPPAKK
ncbi:hypothetical protein P691DRAFT_813128 [Macrolepiota fuliginosa MF-IS2]|uniref:Peptidase S28 n=1 Tax=Macrolepiota fuliginosa MF-IS2 TaxID=1400762 RepID=A0A9P6C5D1_9AGAR|nr:hypothetical protein P691DRAFT_813128 [Macrolepiota fuliginosa MF-IS2]